MLSLPKEIPLERIEIHIIDSMKVFGVDPAVISAYETTLFWLTKSSERTFTKAQLATWDKATGL